MTTFCTTNDSPRPEGIKQPTDSVNESKPAAPEENRKAILYDEFKKKETEKNKSANLKRSAEHKITMILMELQEEIRFDVRNVEIIFTNPIQRGRRIDSCKIILE